MTDEAPLDNLWKKVGRESEAGKLLYKLYNVPNKPLVYYPPVTTKKTPLPFETKRTVSAPKPAIDYPELKPKPTRKFHPIDFVHRRKPQSVIQEENKSRPPPKYPGRPGANREEMKTQLQEKFQFSTGALPKKVMMPASEMISGEIQARRREKKKKEPESDDLESMFDQIVKEIEERQEFLMEMERLGECTEEVEGRIKAEIAERISDLQKIRELM